MTGADIKHFRVSRGLTFRQMAELLRDASHTTISRWEDKPEEHLPSWVDERLLSNLPITMSAADFSTLLDLARRTGKAPEEIFSKALRDYARSLQPKPAPITSPPSPVITEQQPHPTRYQYPDISPETIRLNEGP